MASSSPILVILPGLDGTGLMLKDFCAALAARGIAARVIPYPTDRALGYDALQGYVSERLPDRDYVLLGESFSGPVALRIAASEPPGLKAVVLAASFARFVFPCKRAIAALANLQPPRLTPIALFDQLLMNGKATVEQKRQLRVALSSVDPGVLRLRIREAMDADLPAEHLRIRLPLLYLRAGNDRLMRSASGDSTMALAGNAHLAAIPGPHFILQFSPEARAEAVAGFSGSLFAWRKTSRESQ